MTVQLVRHIVESTAFCLIVALIASLMRRRGAAARHTIWLMGAAKFAVPAALFSATGVWLRSLLPAPVAPYARSTVLSGIVLPHAVTSSGLATSSQIWTLLGLLWAGGSVAMFALWLRRILVLAAPSTPALACDEEALSRLRRRIGLRQTVGLRYSAARMEPGLSGIFRATITIPRGLRKELTPAEFEAVLVHELAHAKRRDNLSTAFVHATACVFWFHPLLWWIERELLRERELACDELVLRHSAAPEDYASGILKVCRFHLQVGVTACGITSSKLKERMEAIMSFRPGNPGSHTPMFLIGALAFLVTLFPLAGGFLGVRLLAQTAESSNPSPGRDGSAPVSCKYRSIAFPKGAVIYVTGMKGTQMCVAGPRGRGRWDWSEDASRKSRPDLIVLPPEKPVPPCEVRPSSSRDTCACQSGEFSNGTIVDSAEGKGKLYCAKGQWRPATRTEQGLE